MHAFSRSVCAHGSDAPSRTGCATVRGRVIQGEDGRAQSQPARQPIVPGSARPAGSMRAEDDRDRTAGALNKAKKHWICAPKRRAGGLRPTQALRKTFSSTTGTRVQRRGPLPSPSTACDAGPLLSQRGTPMGCRIPFPVFHHGGGGGRDSAPGASSSSSSD